jgi:hypothetical protein
MEAGRGVGRAEGGRGGRAGARRVWRGPVGAGGSAGARRGAVGASGRAATGTGGHTGRGEAGTGVIGSVVGVLVFLLLLLFAVQVLVGLYATTVVTATAYDAAKTAAGATARHSDGAQARAVADARRRLGRLGEQAEFTWSTSPDSLALTVRAPRPRLLPRSLVGALGPPDVVRTVRVRVETVR